MSSPISPRAISPHASSTLRIRSKVHSAPSNSGLTLPVLRFGSFASFVVTALSSPAGGAGSGELGVGGAAVPQTRFPTPHSLLPIPCFLSLSRRGVAGGEQLVEDRVDILRR